jgi:Flp pilus assembly protein TadB
MSNTSGLARKALAFIIIAAVAILAFKVVVAVVAGLLHTLLAIVLLAAVAFAVLWALRRL